LLIEQAEALGEPPEDPLLLFSVLYAFWVANYVGFNGDAMRKLAAQFLALAEKQGATVPLMIGHRLMGISLLFTGNIAESRAHYDQAIALYDPAEHRALATRFSHDAGVAVLSYRPFALWLLGYPEAALRDTDAALKDAREIGQAATLMYALAHAAIPNTLCGNRATATAQVQEVLALAEEKSAPHWRGFGMMTQGWLLALSGKASSAVQLITSGIAVYRSTGSTNWMPLRLSHLAMAHAGLDQFDDAWRCVGEAMTAVDTTNERWCEAEVQRVAGEIALMPREPDAAKAEAYFERALAVWREQQAKSWELRAAMHKRHVLSRPRNLRFGQTGWWCSQSGETGLRVIRTRQKLFPARRASDPGWPGGARSARGYSGRASTCRWLYRLVRRAIGRRGFGSGRSASLATGTGSAGVSWPSSAGPGAMARARGSFVPYGCPSICVTTPAAPGSGVP
jgi:predicted ATPase